MPPRPAARSRGLVAACMAAVSIVSCGSREPATADRLFVSRMIPHHHLGMRLIDSATTRAHDVRLRRLVFEMGGYHGTDMNTLERRAKDWNIGPAASFPGQLAESSLSALESLSGSAYDAMWLSLMIEHHRGALIISRDADIPGARQDVRKLARSTQSIQTAEITTMKLLLDELSSG